MQDKTTLETIANTSIEDFETMLELVDRGVDIAFLGTNGDYLKLQILSILQIERPEEYSSDYNSFALGLFDDEDSSSKFDSFPLLRNIYTTDNFEDIPSEDLQTAYFRTLDNFVGDNIYSFSIYETDDIENNDEKWQYNQDRYIELLEVGNTLYKRGFDIDDLDYYTVLQQYATFLCYTIKLPDEQISENQRRGMFNNLIYLFHNCKNSPELIEETEKRDIDVLRHINNVLLNSINTKPLPKSIVLGAIGHLYDEIPVNGDETYDQFVQNFVDIFVDSPAE